VLFGPATKPCCSLFLNPSRDLFFIVIIIVVIIILPYAFFVSIEVDLSKLCENTVV